MPTKTIASGSSVSSYIFTGAGITLFNAGTISGAVSSNYVDTVLNAGTIGGSGGVGIDLFAGGTVTNQTSGNISSTGAGIELYATSLITNLGTIAGSTFGIKFVSGTGTVANAGTISGGSAAVAFASGGANRLIVDPSAVFIGSVEGGSTTDVLELASGSSHGSISSLGTQFNHFGQYLIEASAIWSFYGINQLNGTLTNNGQLALPGTLTNFGTIIGKAVAVTLANGSALLVNGGRIVGNATTGTGVHLAAGTLINQSGGTITGEYGVEDNAFVTDTLVNAGHISGSPFGMILNGFWSLTNQPSGYIGGTSSGFQNNYPGVLLNSKSATIEGGVDAVLGNAALTVVNAGTVTSGLTAVSLPKLFSGSGNRIEIVPGAVFSGLVDGGNPVGTGVASILELTSGGTGTISGLGSHYVNFGQIGVDASAIWALAGSNTIVSGATFADNGTLSNAGNLKGPVTVSTGAAFINNGNMSYGPVSIATGARFTNASGHNVGGGSLGAVLTGAGTVTNAGLIDPFSVGISLQGGGIVTNLSTGLVFSGTDIAGAPGAFGVVVNYGTLQAVGNAVANLQFSPIYNRTGGTILASGAGYGVGMVGGLLVNSKGATISAGTGVTMTGGGTVTNAGAIIGSSGMAVGFAAGAGELMIVDPGAVFSGTVDGGNTIGSSLVSTLALGAGAGTGTLTSLNSKYIDFGYVLVEPGAQWSLATTDTVASGQTLMNMGTLGSVTLASGALFANAATGVLSATSSGAIGVGGAPTIVNNGIILGHDVGIYSFAGGTLTNAKSAAIIGYSAVGFGPTSSTIINAGLLEGEGAGPSFRGVLLDATGAITNQTGGLITGFTGAYLAQGGTVLNAGSIVGSGTIGALLLTAAGQITNFASGVITGATNGVRVFNGAATLVNAGSIAGGSYAVRFPSGYASRLIVDPGAAFSGKVDGGPGAPSALELASGAAQGTLTSVGSQFTNFSQIAFDPGATWFISGDTVGLAANITGFTGGDTIEVIGFAATSDSFTGSGLVLQSASGSATIGITGSFTTSSFNIVPSAGNTFIDVACFAAGTRILTNAGPIAVERLRVGDLVQTAHGDMRPIVWLGHRRIDCARHLRPHRVWPIRIAAHAFGPGRPERPLFLSPDHAVFANGALIPIRCLVNDTTIRQVRRGAVGYWHVELPSHDVLLAEGLPAESYLDVNDRASFDGGMVAMLHPDFASGVWEANACAPIIVSGPELEAVRDGTRSAANPHPPRRTSPLQGRQIPPPRRSRPPAPSRPPPRATSRH